MLLTIRLLPTLQTVAIYADEDATVGDVKDFLSLAIPGAQTARLVLNRVALGDDRALAYYGIASDTLLHLCF